MRAAITILSMLIPLAASKICFAPLSEATALIFDGKEWAENHVVSDKVRGITVSSNEDPFDDTWKMWDHKNNRIYSGDGKSCVYVKYTHDEITHQCIPDDARLVATFSQGLRMYHFDTGKFLYEMGVYPIEGTEYWRIFLIRLKSSDAPADGPTTILIQYNFKLGIRNTTVLDKDVSQCVEVHPESTVSEQGAQSNCDQSASP